MPKENHSPGNSGNELSEVKKSTVKGAEVTTGSLDPLALKGVVTDPEEIAYLRGFFESHWMHRFEYSLVCARIYPHLPEDERNNIVFELYRRVLADERGIEIDSVPSYQKHPALQSEWSHVIRSAIEDVSFAKIRNSGDKFGVYYAGKLAWVEWLVDEGHQVAYEPWNDIVWERLDQMIDMEEVRRRGAG